MPDTTFYLLIGILISFLGILILIIKFRYPLRKGENVIWKLGIALFPANLKDPKIDENSKNVKIDHFAFNVTNENFEKAKIKYEELDLDFDVQDHHYFESIYTKDPDGHTVELTTLKVDEKEFYK